MKYIVGYFVDQIKKIVDKLGKATCLVLVGLFLLLIGFLIYSSRPRVIYNEQSEVKPAIMSEEDAKSLISSILTSALNIYENPSKIFEVKKDETSNEEGQTEEKKENKTEENKPVDTKTYIVNYDEIITKYFTKNGITEFENMKFSDKKYYNKNENGEVYFDSDVILENNKFTNVTYTLTKLVIGEEEISCNINFSKLRIDQLDEVNYEVYTKKLVLVKDENDDSNENKENKTTWLIDSFDYANKKMIEV